MVAVVKRRVPKRHDGIPHVLVDRSLVLNDVARDRRQQAVDQAGQALGIAPVELGDASEAAHIGEQQRHLPGFAAQYQALRAARQLVRSEEHTSELQSLMRISYAVFCLKKK